jgi:hypothetical protein
MAMYSVDSDAAIIWAKEFIAYTEANPEVMHGDGGEVSMWFQNAMARGRDLERRWQAESAKGSRIVTIAARVWNIFFTLFVWAGAASMLILLAAWLTGGISVRL